MNIDITEIIVALIGAVASVVASRRARGSNQSRLGGRLDVPVLAVGLALTALVLSIFNFSQDAVDFGEWEAVSPNVAESGRRADTDGFVAVFTHEREVDRPSREKEGPASVVVWVGRNEGSLVERTRAGRYNGALCPVSKGDWWKIEVRQKGGFTVGWRPIQ